jgi:hypothetical protein
MAVAANVQSKDTFSPLTPMDRWLNENSSEQPWNNVKKSNASHDTVEVLRLQAQQIEDLLAELGEVIAEKPSPKL